MIFVTVGTHPVGFERLVRAMDDVAAGLEEEIVMQVGGTPYTPQHAQCFDFAPLEEQEHWCASASVVVSHAGAGSILTVQKAGKPLVLVPRLKKYGEHIDDHQLELALALEAGGQAVTVQDVSQLASALKRAPQCRWSANARQAELVAELRAVVNQMAGRQDGSTKAVKAK